MFGDPSRFAIDLMFTPAELDVWMHGRSCYWISGERIGNFEMEDTLRDLLFSWEKMSSYRDRTNIELSRLGTQDLITTLYSGLYNTGFADQELFEQAGIDGMWIRHNVNPGTNAFKDWRVFLVDDGVVARCVYARATNPLIGGREQKLRLHEFEGVLEDSIAYLLAAYQQAGGN